MTWFYELDNRAVGPVSSADLESLVRAGSIGRETLVWTEGMPDWTPVTQCIELSDLWKAMPPPLPGGGARRRDIDEVPSADIELGFADLYPLAGPWTRYFARSIDIIVLSYAVVFALFTAAALTSYDLYLALSQINPFLFSMIVLPLALLANAVIVSLFGNSLGKTVFGIKAFRADANQAFDLGMHIARELKVWVQGLGLGLPIVALVTLVLAFNRVSAGKQTRYDEGSTNVLALSDSKLRRWLAMLFALGLSVAAAALGTLAEG
ncbi:MAG: RDD family protein [Rhizobiaceae bacterium]|nr:RDD family protein [Rhizobiaceae bacterium]